jgi:mannose-1-phosphate guanylyltransferase
VSASLWPVILAAGAGRRLASVTGGVPKQFWRGPHGRSLLDRTIDRFATLEPRSQMVIIIDAGHRAYLAEAGLSKFPGTLVVQPEDRGTAAGVFLALTPVLERAPDAVVAITPSDHGVADNASFRLGIREAAARAAERGEIVLFGVEATSARTDYGWITTGAISQPGGLPTVASFVEKPSVSVATRLFESGGVWNTMVMVARASAIRDLYVDLLPELARVFDEALSLSGRARAAYLDFVYPTLARVDFSADLLTRARTLSARVWPASLGWSDLGTPERLHAWHQLTGVSADRSGEQLAVR